MRVRSIALCTAVLCGAAAARTFAARTPVVGTVPGEVRVVANDNRAPAGTLRGGVLTLRLVARAGTWRPDGDSAPGAMVPAFAEEGHEPRIPGPLIRVPAGTEVAVTVRNALAADTLAVHGLGAHPGGDAGMTLAPGAARTVRFRLDAPGTYYYWGTTMGRRLDFRTREDAQLSGAIVVDARGARPAPDRILVIGMWSDTAGRVLARRHRLLAVVNGRSWPHTERLAYTVGDTVRWRVINASADAHPMHLHGFYFRVDSRGDGVGDTVYADAERPLANTEGMHPGSTMSLTWVPEREGNWLFHCHIPEHFSPRGPLGLMREQSAGHMAQHGGEDPHVNHALGEMNGLVVGVQIRPRPAAGAQLVRAASEGARRHLRLLVRRSVGSSAAAPLYAFALQQGATEPPADSGLRNGPPIVLARGEPVSITVVNTLEVPTAVHWHGIELESYYDGVAGFSGAGARLAPVIAPGDSFEARFTPPRAGTFIYHTHVDEENQQLAGLAGPLIVLEPGARYDTATDVTVLVTSPRDSALERRAVLLNGSASPAPLTLRTGVTYRLRFINMTTRRPNMRVELRRDTVVARWRPLAKDGAELPVSLQVARPARSPLAIGETLDVELTPDAPGELRVEARTAPGALLGVLPVRVVPAGKAVSP
ncbi:MAG TPA: multicopper oxidase domain-containing protein [Gemmatimonadaceae bacterium]|nr:multicopper oxidase domain-containing protein [Gemmatimonadaceae bacterium]